MPSTTLWNRRFIFLLIAQAGFGFSHAAFMMLPKFLATELDANAREIGSVVTVSAIAVVFALIPAGAMVDRYGRKYFLASGSALMAVSSVGYVFVHEIGFYLYALRMLQSLAFAYAFAAGSALCVDASPPDRTGQAIGLYGLTFIVMGALAPAAVETLAKLRSWDDCFLLAAGAALFCSLLSLFIREEHVERNETDSAPMREIWARRDMRRAGIVVGLLGVAFGGSFNFYQPYALSLGFVDLRDFFIANSLAAAFCRLALGPFIDRMGLRRVSVISILLYAFMMFAMTWLPEIGLIVLGFGIGCAHGVFSPAYTALVLEGCPRGERGRRLAMIQAGMNIGIGFAGFALGWVAVEFGYPPIFQIASAGLLVAGLLIALAPDRDDTQAEASTTERVKLA